ncbi:Fpg/Nei family DNA glycosylase [Aestuariimicrobium ganziense]|uniref:Fpg/Nei family DNA glycosylase n=1 Tax=Aestuariimicrobium ganziense TaxID=2773677 RepID=UPI00194448EF|nr:DNA-formamidopyrimidine glycosylase family protein [Aestuariimicrobium ganziense]
MPEGHVIHRLAHAVNAAFAGRTVQVTSPQGRFADSAVLLDGHVLSGAQAWGKHLFIDFDAPVDTATIQIHLGLIGKLRVGPIEPVKGLVRLRITDGDTAADLRGPQTCVLQSPAEVDAVVAPLGPDPLRADADPEVAWQRIHRSSKPIAALLMDQRITAGVGNIYRAEVLFRHRIDPACPGNKLKRSSWELIWADLVALMALGVQDGRIDTVTDEHTPEAMGRDARVDRHGGEVYVYRRADLPCWVCGSRVRTRLLEGRNLYWCGRCQRRH